MAGWSPWARRNSKSPGWPATGPDSCEQFSQPDVPCVRNGVPRHTVHNILTARRGLDVIAFRSAEIDARVISVFDRPAVALKVDQQASGRAALHGSLGHLAEPVWA